MGRSAGAMAASRASVSPEGALAPRQLSAARGHCEPLGSRAAAFSSVLPRAQHRCASATARFVRRYRAWRQTELQKQSSPQASLGRAEPAIRAARLFHRCRRCQITTRASYWTPGGCVWPAKSPPYGSKLGNLDGFCAFLARTRSVRTFLGCRSTAATRLQARADRR